MANPRLNVTEQRELRHLSAIRAAGGTLPVVTGAAGTGIDGRSAKALAGKEMVRLSPDSGKLLCILTDQGAARLAALLHKSS
ncbi:hypothetical protein V5F40_22885 [Xanthobacter sp. DSM 14520]|uniref:hypothetical protein n=1 Tax=Xanthobacter autotrophicus (strain ATCC BAA-1158 / Py2) TaxID=78245 RepID=UPI00372B53F5